MVHQRHRAAGPLQVLITPSAVFIIGCFNLRKLNVWKIERGPSAEHSQRRRTDPAVVCFKNEPFYSPSCPPVTSSLCASSASLLQFFSVAPRVAAATAWVFFQFSFAGIFLKCGASLWFLPPSLRESCCLVSSWVSTCLSSSGFVEFDAFYVV